MYEAGQPLQDIMKALAIGHKSLCELMRKHNIEVRKVEKRLPWVEGDAAYIPLTKGYTAIIDLADLHLVGDWQWYASVRYDCAGNVMCVYAQSKQPLPDGTKKWFRLHRVILNPDSGFDVDHIDSDGLNNRRANLRVATRAQNTANQRLTKVKQVGHQRSFFLISEQKSGRSE
jgi:HNH endonuclease.